MNTERAYGPLGEELKKALGTKKFIDDLEVHFVQGGQPPNRGVWGVRAPQDKAGGLGGGSPPKEAVF